jgi:mannose-1-phosphate guanylyltransferase
MTMRMYAVIPAGGSGTRLWPASRASQPKFLLPFPGPRSMLQSTLDRLDGLVDPKDTFILTGRDHAVNVARQLPTVPAENIVVEPAARGSGPAIGFGAMLVAMRDPDAIMGSFAADHFIANQAAFQQAVQAAAEVASDGYLVTIGIEPRRPETGYGYIRRGEKLGTHGPLCSYQVVEFKEKPDLPTATRYVQSGEYLWNASIFVWRARTLIDAMREFIPDVYDALAAIADRWETDERERALEEYWHELRDVTIDHGIMEHARNVAVVPVDCGWTDLGDWNSLGEILADGDAENLSISAEHVHEETRSTLIFGNNRLVATLGVENLIIVDTDDVLLVCDRSRAQDVRKIVQRLKNEGQSGLV